MASSTTIFSSEVIESFAENYSTEQLSTLLAQAQQQLLDNPSAVITANVGGNSYSREVQYTPADLIYILKRAMMKQLDPTYSLAGSNSTPVSFLLGGWHL